MRKVEVLEEGEHGHEGEQVSQKILNETARLSESEAIADLPFGANIQTDRQI